MKKSQREILELKSTIVEISLDGVNRLSRVEERICELEDKIIKIIQSESRKKKE